ncbi:killer cell lectin-like receptor subfamily B member 1B allele B [Pseudophryne corroboree]|uniref:killer cell lectin-like receptor subfamily B member 1B allele B n=1 Tax=Pseudophryne corroboree TaxID=495146 RepID=UPI003081E5CF
MHAEGRLKQEAEKQITDHLAKGKLNPNGDAALGHNGSFRPIRTQRFVTAVRMGPECACVAAALRMRDIARRQGSLGYVQDNEESSRRADRKKIDRKKAYLGDTGPLADVFGVWRRKRRRVQENGGWMSDVKAGLSIADIVAQGPKVQCLNCDNCTMMAKKVEQLCAALDKTSEGCALCPSKWLLHGDNCYYYSDDTRRTWDQSREQCEMMGGHLLVIEDQGQQEFIQRFVTEEARDMIWIGLYHEGDRWRWVNRRRYNTSLFQVKVISGNCVLVDIGGYYSENCNVTHTFICQRKTVMI